jgi:hypothetical protein
MRFAVVLPLAVCACALGTSDNSPLAQCQRQAEEDPTVQAIYRGNYGDYTQWGAVRDNLIWSKRQATQRCLAAKGLAPSGGVEPIRPPL